MPLILGTETGCKALGLKAQICATGQGALWLTALAGRVVAEGARKVLLCQSPSYILAYVHSAS